MRTDAVAVAYWAQVATIAVAIFAAVQILKELLEARRRQKAASAVISATAFGLRQEMLSWFGPDPQNGDDALEEWVRESIKVGAFELRVDTIASAFLSMFERSDAAAVQLRLLRLAYVYFLEGTRRIRRFVTEGRPGDLELFSWIQLRTDAVADMRACIQTLEAGVIDKDFIRFERELRQIRERDEPFAQLAQALITDARRRRSFAERQLPTFRAALQRVGWLQAESSDD